MSKNPRCTVEHEGECPEPRVLWSAAQDKAREEYLRSMEAHGHIYKSDTPRPPGVDIFGHRRRG